MQEDSVIINRSAVDRGLFVSTVYRTLREQNNKNHSTGEEEYFCRPDPLTTRGIKPYNYEKLQSDGFAQENTYMEAGDVIIGKVMPHKNGAVVTQKDTSVTLKSNERGFIDRNCHGDRYFTNVTGDGYTFAKVRMRNQRVPTIGDKVSCYTPDHDILTWEEGWISVASVDPARHHVATWCNGQLVYQRPSAVQAYDYSGPLMHVFEPDGNLDILVTPEHRMFVVPEDEFEPTVLRAMEMLPISTSSPAETIDPATANARWGFVTNVDDGWIGGIPYQNVADASAALLRAGGTGGYYNKHSTDFLILLGAWMAKGSHVYVGVSASASAGASSTNSLILRTEFHIALGPARELVCKALSRLGIPHYVDGHTRHIIIPSSASAPGVAETIDALHQGWQLPGLAAPEPGCQHLVEDGVCAGVSQSDNQSLVWTLPANQARVVLGTIHAIGPEHNVSQGDMDRLRLHAGAGSSGSWWASIRDVCAANGEIQWVHGYTGTVHCCSVPRGPGILYVRRNSNSGGEMVVASRGVWCGNSRSGQKGTIGMLYRQEDMPFTAGGIVPSLIMNPHAIPSRMTVGQLMEAIDSKAGVHIGRFGDATPFNGRSVEDIAQELQDMGFERYGNEIMYNPRTGEQVDCPIFICPTYYQRLKHMTEDKQHSRAANGPVVLLTRQPAEGRARDGGLRLGEMELECLWAHGTQSFLKERFMECSDNYRVFVCRGCWMMAPVNPERGLYYCRACQNTTDFVEVRMPYASKLLLQEMQTMSIGARLITQ